MYGVELDRAGQSVPRITPRCPAVHCAVSVATPSTAASAALLGLLSFLPCLPRFSPPPLPLDARQVVRTSLLPGLLKTLGCNRSAAVRDGLRVFEISDVVLRDASSDVGASNRRRLGAVYTGAGLC